MPPSPNTKCWCDYCGKEANTPCGGGATLATDEEGCDICMECTVEGLEMKMEQGMWKAKIQYTFGIPSDSEYMEEITDWILEVQSGGGEYFSWITDLTTLSVVEMITFVDQARGDHYRNTHELN